VISLEVDRIKHEYMKTNVTVFSRCPTKITFKLFMDLLRKSSLIEEFRNALLGLKLRPRLFSHKAADIRKLQELHKKDIEAAPMNLITEVRKSELSIEALIS